MVATLHLTAGAACRPSTRTSSRRSRIGVVVRADNRPLREYREDDDSLTTSGQAAAPQKQQPGALYADENPPPPRDTMSKEMKEKLRREYYGLGGSPNQAMGGNYFLYIILGISLLAVLSKLTGAI